ncbi:efflux RND transporter periplasmic adaptor subunit [Undibacterium sp. CY18W]|uniref:Efflux RND transporter periplasmic adaptor subunit n=1 Tax=Undibacterium hunanense TaxID=2762292 RepID=A0ABR6ZQ55_9BURK|nr:efflux RND transporter periplasmic adaptor subunit [Undibacterium hunanense]MBC3918046.1 efflux RND transporter periplasmic adaptor subunit [Undibacterium hunanense]
MKLNINKKTVVPVAIVIAVGLLLAVLILNSGKSKNTASHDSHTEQSTHADQEHHGEKNKDAHTDGQGHADKEHHSDAIAPQKGPHGGKLFTKDGYALEVSIFEQNTAPEFRLYTYQDGKALSPADSQLTLKLERLGRAAQSFSFTAEKDYLKSTVTVDEPHSFKVGITAMHAGKNYQFNYEQIEGRISMDALKRKQNGVEIQTAGSVKLQGKLSVLGEVRLNEDSMLQIVPRLAGIVESVAVNAGDKVSKGQVLAVISSQALVDLRSDLLATQKRHALARNNFEREKKLWEEKISAEQDYLQARNTMQEAEITLQSAQQKLNSLGAGNTTGKQLSRYEIRSPIAGTITEKQITMGQSLKDDVVIFTVADLSSVWVEISIPAKDLSQVRTGQTARVSANAFDASADGKLSYVGAVMGEQTRSAKARLLLPNTAGNWYPGLTVNVALLSGDMEVAVAVANDAIQLINERPVVFGSYGDQFEARPLELGRSDGKFTEVRKGLQANEAYVIKNSFLIKAELGKAAASHDH